MFFRLLPRGIRKYFLMSKRQRKHEIRLTLWHIPLLYVVGAMVISGTTMYLDVGLGLPFHTELFAVNFETTRLLVSTLIGSILFLSVLTLNILLVLLTMYSDLFSPRMMEDFISDRVTQNFIGLFNGNFIYVLLIFLFMSGSRNLEFVVVPIITVLLTLLTAVGFIFFINHATNWMLVHNVTSYMRTKSEEITRNSISVDTEKHKVIEPGDLKEAWNKKKKIVQTARSGYIQLIDFPSFIEKAEEDDIIIEIHEKIGDFILDGMPLFSYWGKETTDIDEEWYRKLIIVGHKGTEIQDFNASMSKLAEVAIKSIGNSDPKSAINSIHQLTDLMQAVDASYTFSSYLAGSDGQVRVITKPQRFKDFLYGGLGFIRHYAPDNFPVIIEIISSLRMLARSIDPIRHEDIWRFAENTIRNISASLVYELDRKFLLEALKQLAETTNHMDEFYQLEDEFMKITI